MTTTVDVVNIGLQYLGTRTTVSAAELANNSKNEAIQANLILTKLRDQTLRMAPWNCGQKTANLVYITSAPGTPENPSAATTLWEPGQPPPPWAYEYQYPVDCVRPCWIIPATQTGFAGGVPITTAVTGGAPSFWFGAPIPYRVQTDTFFPAVSATPSAGGAGYALNDVITLNSGPGASQVLGAPAQLLVTGIGVGGSVTSVDVISAIFGSSPPFGGSYFSPITTVIGQGSTSGVGTGFQCTLTFGTASPQRVILTNQEFATLSYIQRVTDPNVMDELFVDAWSAILGARLCMALTGDKGLANIAIEAANTAIAKARTADGNEGLVTNDVTPDFIRVRGVAFTEYYSGPYGQGFEWGNLWAYV